MQISVFATSNSVYLLAPAASTQFIAHSVVLSENYILPYVGFELTSSQGGEDT